jgi:hypothetical protein
MGILTLRRKSNRKQRNLTRRSPKEVCQLSEIVLAIKIAKESFNKSSKSKIAPPMRQKEGQTPKPDGLPTETISKFPQNFSDQRPTQNLDSNRSMADPMQRKMTKKDDTDAMSQRLLTKLSMGNLAQPDADSNHFSL